MIITISFISLLFIGIAIVVIDKIIDEKTHYVTPDWLRPIGSFIITVFSVASVLAAVILFVNVVSKNVDYEAALYEKQVLEARLEQVQDNPYNVGNEYLYHDIVEFNNNLRSVKKWANNPWTSWFNNEKIASIDYVDIPILNE